MKVSPEFLDPAETRPRDPSHTRTRLRLGSEKISKSIKKKGKSLIYAKSNLHVRNMQKDKDQNFTFYVRIRVQK